MKHFETPCLRLAWAAALAAAAFISPSWAFALPPPDQRVDFAKHGADWFQGSCASRKKQSPIDLNEMFKPPGGTFQYKYGEVVNREIEIANDGRMLSTTVANSSFPGGLALSIGGIPAWFNLTSIDVKSESEHTIRGKHFPLEIQLVHRPAHFYKDSTGPESVTVSIFVSCNTPPKAPEVYPGLLQESSRSPGLLQKSSRSLKRNLLSSDRAAALLQQDPMLLRSDADSDSMLPPAGEEDEDIDDDPVHERMNGEINFVHTLVEGEDFLAASPAAAPAAAPGGAPGAPGAAPEVYEVPSPMQPNFNPLLQFLVAQEPPDLDSSVITGIGPDMPLRMGSLLAGGTYFYYWGSSTLPPCKERDMWLIKREIVMASDEQVRALYDKVHLLSGGAGNYRTSMPLNRRAVEVLSGVEGIPRELVPETHSHDDDVPGKEQKYIDVAKDAITIAKAASDYAKDLDWRLQAGSTAHLREMQAPEPTTPRPTTSAFIPAPPNDQEWATKIMANIVKKSIHDALKANIDEMIPATVSLTSSYLRQRLLKRAGFGTPPLTAEIIPPKPIPGVPTFFPPEAPGKLRGMKRGQNPSSGNATQSPMEKLLIASGCTAAANYSGCGNVTGLTTAQATAAATNVAANNVASASSDTDGDGDVDADDAQEEAQMTPAQVAPLLPPGVQPVPADWPDPDAWPNGLPPDNWPTGADPNVWPNPDGNRPSGWTDYQWQRYKYNWGIYRSSYKPYQSSYSGYSISRRRRASSSSSGRRRRSSSYSSSGRRRSSSSSYSSRRRSSSRGRRRRR